MWFHGLQRSGCVHVCREMNEWGMMEETKWARNRGLVMGALTENVSFNHTDLQIQAACTSSWIWVPAWAWTECRIRSWMWNKCTFLKIAGWYKHVSFYVTDFCVIHNLMWANGISIPWLVHSLHTRVIPFGHILWCSFRNTCVYQEDIQKYIHSCRWRTLKDCCLIRQEMSGRESIIGLYSFLWDTCGLSTFKYILFKWF